jgi:ABC-2 type transport system permease protein
MTALTGTGALVRLGLRRDRVILPVWILGLAVMVNSTASALVGLYSQASQREELAATMAANKALIALLGPLTHPDSLGATLAWRGQTFYASAVGLMALFTVVRHTRREEESGRLELIGSAVVGRFAALAAALMLGVGASVAVGLLSAALLAAQHFPAAGSLALGAALAVPGVVFAGLAAVTAQVTQTARSASALAGGGLAIAFGLRSAADVDPGALGWLGWLSPVGWTQRVDAYIGDRYDVVLLAVAATAVLVVGAVALARRRDYDAGLLPDRLGPGGSASLTSPLALAWREQRGLLLGWVVAFGAYGLLVGSMAESVGTLTSSSPQFAKALVQLGGSSGLIDAFLSALMAVIGIVASAYAVQATLRMRSEEVAGRTELVLATNVGRRRWLLGHAGIAVGGTAVLMVVAGLGVGIADGLGSGHLGSALGRALEAAAVQIPAAIVLGGVAVALFGLVPRLAALAWVGVVFAFVIGELGSLFNFPRWLVDVSPFTHVPAVLSQPYSSGPLVVLVGIAAVLIAVGAGAFRRRDLVP